MATTADAAKAARDLKEQLEIISELSALCANDPDETGRMVDPAEVTALARRLESFVGKGATVELMVGRGSLSRGTVCVALFCTADAYSRLRMPVLARLNFVARTFSDDRSATVQVKKNRWGAETYCQRDQIVWTAGFEFDFSPLPLGS